MRHTNIDGIVTWILIVAVFDHARGATCPDGGGAQETPALRLKRRLFCDYDRNVRPINDPKMATTVSVFIKLKSYALYEKKNKMALNTRLSLQWKDEFLKWNKSEFDDINSMLVRGSDIWIPDVALFNTGDMIEDETANAHLEDLTCVVRSTGDLNCATNTVFSVLCSPDIYYWPFDQHNCTMTIGSWGQYGDVIDMQLISTGMSVLQVLENNAFQLVGSSAVRMTDDLFVEERGTTRTVMNPYLKFSFLLKAHPGGKAASVLTPSIVLASLTLLTFFLDAACPERIMLICFNIFMHCSYLPLLGANLPPNGQNTPIILVFFRNSLLMLGLSLIITLLVRRLEVVPTTPPPWITKFTDAASTKLPGWVLVADEAVETAGEETTIAWRRLSIILDRVGVIFFLVVYVAPLASLASK